MSKNNFYDKHFREILQLFEECHTNPRNPLSKYDYFGFDDDDDYCYDSDFNLSPLEEKIDDLTNPKELKLTFRAARLYQKLWSDRKRAHIHSSCNTLGVCDSVDGFMR